MAGNVLTNIPIYNAAAYIYWAPLYIEVAKKSCTIKVIDVNP